MVEPSPFELTSNVTDAAVMRCFFIVLRDESADGHGAGNPARTRSNRMPAPLEKGADNFDAVDFRGVSIERIPVDNGEARELARFNRAKFVLASPRVGRSKGDSVQRLGDGDALLGPCDPTRRRDPVDGT